MTEARYVELIDGKLVSRDAEEWRDECLARWVLSLKPLLHRRDWLYGFEKKHGTELTEKLKANMQAIWEKR